MLKSLSFILDQITPITIYSKLKSLFPEEVSLLFESGEGGSFSFILIGAKERIQYSNRKTIFTFDDGRVEESDRNPFQILKEYYAKLDKEYYKKESAKLDIGFIDGFIGYIGYEAIELFEPVLTPYIDQLANQIDIPDIDLIRPKLVIAYSHKNSRLTLISSEANIVEKFGTIEEILKSEIEYLPLKKAVPKGIGEFLHSEEKFFKMVADSKEMIKSGDVFQILISNRYIQEFEEIDPFSFYRVLRSKNPSPYMFYMDYIDFQIVGSSPEVMVKLFENEILLRPIAGTRKRGKNLKRDLELEKELTSDPKERAEHLMLIDLGRNDVGRVAKAGSVRVPNIMRVERYSHVMHMVSDIYGELDKQFDMFDLLKATFTAGTMTGAPKIRAMELIAQFEGIKRNFYSGTVGYFGFDGNMDSSIAIRTALIKDRKVYIQAGAGIVADSVDRLEALEVRNKMNALISTLKDLQSL